MILEKRWDGSEGEDQALPFGKRVDYTHTHTHTHTNMNGSYFTPCFKSGVVRSGVPERLSHCSV